MALDSLRFVFVGSGIQLVASAESALARGHRVIGVVSDCPHVRSWTTQRGIACGSANEDILSFVQREPYDYLISIVHHAIIDAAVLQTAARGAINYHDSPLPAYAGFNATSWALLDGQGSHGVTWHRMTAEVDDGAILLQRRFDIADDDTAFTLSVKCSQAGSDAFEELLERAQWDGTPQGPGRSFHLRSERPDVALLDPRLPARALHRVARALQFGPDDNWMATPKLWLGEHALAVGEVRLGSGAQAPAGTVLSIAHDGLTLATSDGSLRLGELRTLAGELVDPHALRERFGVCIGAPLPTITIEQAGAVREFDQLATKHERYWVRRLQQLKAPRLSDLAGATARDVSSIEVSPAVHTRELAPSFLALDVSHETLVAALAAFVARVGEGGSFDLGLARDHAPLLDPFYAAVTPLHVALHDAAEATTTFAALRGALAHELAESQRRGAAYARDVVLRYRVLRERAPSELVLPIAVRTDGVPALVEGSRLTLVMGNDPRSLTWVHDPQALTAVAASRLFERFEVLLEHALREPDTELRRLPLLPLAERELLLHTWQDTAAVYESDRCLHTLFEAQVDRTPMQTALRFRDQTLSYRELDQCANRVAHTLRAHGVGPDVLVGLCIERSLEMVIGLLGILKAGGAYVPLDPAYPRDRLALMLEDARSTVVLTQESLLPSLPASGAQLLFVESLLRDEETSSERVCAGATADDLAYVIFTSGSTGRPKGVMVQHGNAANFFAGMDRVLGDDPPGRWLAVTSISFDISVLELFWTLSRGFEVVLQGELDRASLAKSARSSFARAPSRAPMGFGLFYFAAETGASASGDAYRLLLEGARFADEHDFAAVWTPERHFHAFGGLYPNPAITTAALATITKRVQLRAGSIVLPLHNPLRVAEDWAVIDHLAGGRIGLSFASGWHVNDFAFMPENYERRREIMLESIDTVRRLWRGEKVSARNGQGQPIEVSVLPRPLNPNPPIWVASAGNVETFQLAGRQGFHVLTNMLGQDLADLRNKLRAYREARREGGHEGRGVVSVMLHTFVCDDTERARALARRPFSNYLASSFDLVKVAPWMFPAFKRPSQGAQQDPGFDPSSFTPEDMQALLDHAFDRYFDTAGLFGSPEHALEMVEQLKTIGVDEVACLIDFGIETEEALRGLVHLDRLRQLSNREASTEALTAHEDRAAPDRAAADDTLAAQLTRHQITHLQCTPSMARMLLSDPEARAALAGVKKLLLGGEALPRELADQLLPLVGGAIVNMYGPTETTVWSTTAQVTQQPITIGRPIANTVIRILDRHRELVPIGVAGELCIGGAGVVRGYLGRADLTAERFIEDPFCAHAPEGVLPRQPGQRLYRTGDLARYRDDGELEFLGRLDHQVKVQGYRIELGEIESALARHPSVRQSVVVPHSEQGTTQLVAYYTANGGASSEQDPSARVSQWQSLWDETYKLAASDNEAASTPRFNIAGWRDSFTGAPIPAAEMREWLAATLARTLEHGPRRVLEIGCGTGMILYGLLPHVEHYTAVDVSPHALETIRRELTPAELAKVTLVNQPAHQLEGLSGRSFDTVIINSVAQYFPDQAYLSDVLQRVSALVHPGGRILVGDVRNLAHLRAFHTRAELTQAQAECTARELSERIERRLRNEGELLFAESFFEGLPSTLSRIAAVDVQLKRGAAHNEMTCFRFDVTLHVGKAPVAEAIAPLARGIDTIPKLQALLADQPPIALVQDVPNARLSGVYSALEALARPDGTAKELRQQIEAAPRGVDPEALVSLDPAYEVDIRQARSGDLTRFDVVFRHRQKASPSRVAFAPLQESTLVNQPAKGADASAHSHELREHLRASLPEYMVPALFVPLSVFPLTPNGKIDRQALPSPEPRVRAAAVALALPSGELEQKVAGVWQAVLGVEQVGREENIFDLGANSLLTVQAANRLSTVLGKKVSLVSMFRFPTVASLATHLADGQGSTPPFAGKQQTDERLEKRASAAERRRQLRERNAQGVRDV